MPSFVLSPPFLSSNSPTSRSPPLPHRKLGPLPMRKLLYVHFWWPHLPPGDSPSSEAGKLHDCFVDPPFLHLHFCSLSAPVFVLEILCWFLGLGVITYWTLNSINSSRNLGTFAQCDPEWIYSAFNVSLSWREEVNPLLVYLKNIILNLDILYLYLI